MVLGIILCIFCILWRTPQEAHAQSSEEMNKAATISVAYGLIDEIKFGRHMTLEIEVKSHDAFGVEGFVQVITRTSQGGSCLYRQEISVPAGGVSQAAFYVPLMREIPNMYIQVVDSEDEPLAEYDLQFPAKRMQVEVFAGVLGNRYDVVDFLDGMAVDEFSDALFQAFSLDIADMPENALGLDMLDLIFVNEKDFDTLTKNQKKAIDRWIKKGGVLLTDTGEAFSVYSEDAYKSVPEGDGLRVSLSFALESLVEQCEGGGSRSQATAFFMEVLTEQRINNLESDWYGNNSEYWESYSLVNSLPADKVPNLWKYALIVICYILLVGPVLFLVLRRKGLQKFLRVSVVTLAVLFSALIFVISSETRFERPFINYGTIIHMNQDSVEKEVYFGLRSPNNQPYEATISNDYALLPLDDEIGVYYTSSFLGFGSSYVRSHDYTARPVDAYQMILDRGESETTIQMAGQVAFTTECFYASSTQANEAGSGIDSEITLFDGKIDGVVKNHTGYDLTGAVLIMNQQIVLLGDIKNEESLSLSGREVHDFTADTYNLSLYLNGLFGDNAMKVGQAGYVQATKKAQILQFVLNKTVKPFEQQDMLLAFPENEEEVCFIDDKDIEIFGISLIMSDANVSREKNGLLYRAFPEKSPVVLDGYYNAYGNTLYDKRNPVLLYDLGENLEIETLTFRNGVTDAGYSFENREQFTGKWYFYNVITGAYDEKDIGKKVYRANELAVYLNEKNQIQIRFEQDTINEGKTVALPYISVTGRMKNAGN